MKPKKAKGWECPYCNDFYAEFDEAKDCPCGEPEEVDAFQCPKCDEIYEYEGDAEGCCE